MFFSKGKANEEKFVQKTTRKLAQFVANSGYRLFKDEGFRRQFDFAKQERMEQDRLFNELEVTGLSLLLFVLEDAEKYGREEKKVLWQRVRQRTIKDFLNWLRELNIPQKFVSLWEKVIEMRYKEYREWLPKIYRGSGIADPKFIESDDERRKDSYVRFMTIAIGAIHHLRKGDTSPKDPFFKDLRTWLEVLNYQLEEKIFK